MSARVVDLDQPEWEKYVAIVDESDWEERLSQFKWYYHTSDNGTQYARCRAGFMHNLVMGPPPPGYEFDHLNDNGLDNRRRNLELVTKSENRLRAFARADARRRARARYNERRRNKAAELRNQAGIGAANAGRHSLPAREADDSGADLFALSIRPLSAEEEGWRAGRTMEPDATTDCAAPNEDSED